MSYELDPPLSKCRYECEYRMRDVNLLLLIVSSDDQIFNRQYRIPLEPI